jgi:hypothetical protein
MEASARKSLQVSFVWSALFRCLPQNSDMLMYLVNDIVSHGLEAGCRSCPAHCLTLRVVEFCERAAAATGVRERVLVGELEVGWHALHVSRGIAWGIGSQVDWG